MIEAVLFDLGDTVVRLNPFPGGMASRLELRIAECLGIEQPVTGPIAARIESAVAADIKTASSSVRRDEVDIEGLVQQELAGDSIDLTAAQCRAIADVYGEADIERIADVADRTELLSILRARGLRLAIVSNTTTRPELLTAMLTRFGLDGRFNALVYSSEARVRKPHAEIYELALRGLGVRPEAALFVGDRLREDVIGPSRLGMRAVLTQEFHRDPHAGEPHAVIQRLSELVTVLDRL